MRPVQQTPCVPQPHVLFAFTWLPASGKTGSSVAIPVGYQLTVSRSCVLVQLSGGSEGGHLFHLEAEKEAWRDRFFHTSWGCSCQ